MVSLFVLFIRNTDYLAGYHASMRVGQPTLSPDRNVSIREKNPGLLHHASNSCFSTVSDHGNYVMVVERLWITFNTLGNVNCTSVTGCNF